MEFKLIIVLIVVFACTSDAYYFAWRRRHALAKAKPTTCNVQDLLRPTSEMSFRPKLACNADEIVDVRPNDPTTEAAVGIECTFTYSCPLDRPGPQRRSSMVCGDNGEWSGNMPDCSEDERMAQSILDLFEEGMLMPEQAQEKKEQGMKEDEIKNDMNAEEEAEEEEDEEQPTSSVRQTTPKKRGRNANQRRKLISYCKEQNICSNLRSAFDCQKAAQGAKSKIFPTLNRMLTGMCYFCYKNYCKRGIKFF